MAKRRGEQKHPVKRRREDRAGQISPGRWFSVIVTALLVLAGVIMALGLLKRTL